MHEEKIVQLIRDRDENGAKELLLHYGPLIRYIIAPILPNKQDQEECLSEITMKIWDKIDTYDIEKRNFSRWLTALTRNTALNKARQNKRYGEMTEIPEAVPAKEPTPEEVVLYKEKLEHLKAALHDLSEKDRLIFYRKYYYMQSVAQIAAEMGMTERAVEGKLYRLKKQLRKKLGGEWYA